MTKIYIVRHCEAMGNVLRIFQGHTDLDISELGAKQLEYLRKRFSNIGIDKVISSPLLRARKTAKAVIGSRKIPLEINDGLIELHAGIAEGKPFEETFAKYPILADIWFNHPQDFEPEGGEKMKNAYNRIWDTIKLIAKENKDKTIVCATHGGVIRCLNCRLLKNDINLLNDIPLADNTAVSLIEFDDDMNCKINFFNDVSHLPENLINRKSRIAGSVAGEKL